MSNAAERFGPNTTKPMKLASAPGTPWHSIPDDWSCPDCGLAKSEFDMEEAFSAKASSE